MIYKRNSNTACLRYGLLNILSSLLRLTAPKKDSFQNSTVSDKAPGHPVALIEMYNEINVFIPANTIFILRPMDQGVIFTVKSYSLTNTVHKVIASIDSDSSNEPGKRKMETSRMHHSRCH